MRSDVQDNRCKIDMLVSNINETIAEECDEMIQQFETMRSDVQEVPRHILIATGWPGIKTEVIDLSDNPADIPSSCSGIGDFPVQIGGAVGGNINSRPIICGGQDTNKNA